jgi:uncharacterized protein (DUF1778 family)
MSSAAKRDVTINVRISKSEKNLIDRAAAITGRNRTEFVLESARQRAETVLLDQNLFVLDDVRYKKFLEILAKPPKPIPALKKLLASKAPWEA